MKLKIGVLFGGDSVEHEVSVISASQAMAALDEEKYEVVPLYISKTHRLYSSPKLRDMDTYRDLVALEKNLPQVSLVRVKQKFMIIPIEKKLFGNKDQEVDIVIPVVHGTHCEDGTVQGFLEMIGIPYSGCDVMAGAVGQDKVLMKHVLQNSGIPIVDWFWFYFYDLPQRQEEIEAKADKIGYPLVIKPANLGSSVGITVAKNIQELNEAIKEAGQYDNKIVVEKAVTNLREINCSVLGYEKDVKASTLEEVGKSDEILSYQNKYQGGKKGPSKGMASTTRSIPAPLSAEMTSAIQNLAIETFRELGASGVSRIDFLMDAETEKVYVNEINTNPGSLSFYLWEASGIKFPVLMDMLVKQAIDRQRRRERMIFSYSTNLLSTYKSGGSKGSKR